MIDEAGAWFESRRAAGLSYSAAQEYGLLGVTLSHAISALCILLLIALPAWCFCRCIQCGGSIVWRIICCGSRSKRRRRQDSIELHKDDFSDSPEVARPSLYPIGRLCKWLRTRHIVHVTRRQDLGCRKSNRGSGGRCSERQSLRFNVAGIRVLSPYCRKHAFPADSASEIDKFVPFSKGLYTTNLNTLTFRAEKSKNATRGSLFVKELESHLTSMQSVARNPKAGFIYLFVSQSDLDKVKEVQGKPYMYKIGMTTQARARDRVEQWPNSVFGDREGTDWFRVSDAHRAEQIVHDLLGKERLMRFNSATNRFEVEWFFVTLGEATQAMKLMSRVFAPSNRKPDTKRLKEAIDDALALHESCTVANQNQMPTR